MSVPTLTKLQELEKEALTGDRQAVLKVVSALRRYRAAVKELLEDRWGDGTSDGVATNTLNRRVDEIEEPAEDPPDTEPAKPQTELPAVGTLVRIHPDAEGDGSFAKGQEARVTGHTTGSYGFVPKIAVELLNGPTTLMQEASLDTLDLYSDEYTIIEDFA